MTAPTGEGKRPSPSRGNIEAALRLLDGGPVTVGPLAFRVCEVMGVDTAGCSGSYALRGRLSWPGYLSRLEGLVRDRTVVVRTIREWRQADGSLFGEGGQQDVKAYALASVARASGAVPSARERALAYGRARVLRENGGLVERYAREWLDRNSGGDGHE